MRRKKKIPFVFILIFIAAIIAAIVIAAVVPVPAKWKTTLGFGLANVLSFIGVFIYRMIMQKKSGNTGRKRKRRRY